MASLKTALKNPSDTADWRDSAEFRGPGVRHQFDDGADDYDLDTGNPANRGFGLRQGRIILLGDGTEVHADQDDDDLFDPTEEDKDSGNQVRASTTDSVDEAHRGYREDTPGPQLTHTSTSE
jgi:protein phosphatase 2C family protein 2/3